ncbi:MAG: AAA family ATPase [Thermoplasmataceae archaeon]
MKIQTIRIQNIKILESIDVHPRMINILVGRNNTGKTSFLEAISMSLIPEYVDKFLNQPASIINYGKDHGQITIKTDEKGASNVSVDLAYATTNELVKEILRDLKDWSVIGQDDFRYFDAGKPVEKLLIEFSDRSDMILQSIGATLQQDEMVGKYDRIFYNDSLFFEVNDHKILMKGGNYVKELRRLQLQFTEQLVHSLENPQLKRFVKAALEERDRFTGRNRYSSRTRIVNKEKIMSDEVHFLRDPLENLEQLRTSTEPKENLAKTIEEIILEEGLINNLVRFGFSSIVLKINDKNVEVPIDSMGDGFKCLVSILASIQSYQKDCVFLIEEPEVHLHPGYIQELTKFLISLSRKLKIQLFISTHSLDFVTSFLYCDSMNDEDKLFLKSEFLLLRFDKIADTVIIEQKDFDNSYNEIDTLSNDLRGI